MKKISWIVLGVIAVVGVIVYYRYAMHSGENQIAFSEVAIKKGTIEVTVLSTGVVAPLNRLEIKSPIAGRVDTILVDEGDTIKKGQILAWMSSTERAALIDDARAKGPAEVKKWEELYRPAPIIAPLDGNIIKRNIVPGQTFSTADAVFVMSDRLIVNAQVDETDIAQIKLKQKANIILDAYPDLKISSYVKEISFDSVTVNNVTTYLIYVIPDQVPPAMRSGMTANVNFKGESKSNILVVPSNAIKVQDGKSVVMMPPQEKGEPLVQREIRTGITDGKQLEVKSGLKEGDVILVPQYKLQEAPSGSSPFSPLGTPRY